MTTRVEHRRVRFCLEGRVGVRVRIGVWGVFTDLKCSNTEDSGLDWVLVRVWVCIRFRGLLRVRVRVRVRPYFGDLQPYR